MQNSIVQQDIASLIDGWIQAEQNGVRFPVPLHDHWDIAGHKYKKNAFELVESLLEKDLDFSLPLAVRSANGRKQKAMMLSVAGLEHLCMAAHTEQGKSVREVYRQAKQKWDLVKQIAPRVSEEVEVLHLKIELAKIEAQKAALEDKTISLRHYVVTVLPKPTADRILGVTEVKEIEYRDRIVKDNQIINDGGTINKTEICHRFGILTKNGKPDYPRLNRELDSMNLPSSAWEETDVVQTNRELRREYLDILDRALYTAEQRQMWMGE
jgi:hypothetical protein